MNKELFINKVSKIDQTFEDEFKAEFNSPELILDNFLSSCVFLPYIKSGDSKNNAEQLTNDYLTINSLIFKPNMGLNLSSEPTVEDLTSSPNDAKPNVSGALLSTVNSNSKLKNECLFCKSRFVYERVVTNDMYYDEVACIKHIKELHKHSDIYAPKIMKNFISSTGIQKRGSPI